MKALERILEGVSPEPFSGCWIWTKSVDRKGYANSSDSSFATRKAHILLYMHLVGPIAEGLQLDHLCRVRCCVNPAHLEPVTLAENVRRGKAGIHQKSKTHCKNGHEFTPENTRLDAFGWRICLGCKRDDLGRQIYNPTTQRTHYVRRGSAQGPMEEAQVPL